LKSHERNYKNRRHIRVRGGPSGERK